MPKPYAHLRTRRCGERGAQSLEWIGLGSFVTVALVAAAQFASTHGDTLGQLLIGHIKTALGG